MEPQAIGYFTPRLAPTPRARTALHTACGKLNVNPENSFQLAAHAGKTHHDGLTITLAHHPYYATLIPFTPTISIVRIHASLATGRTRDYSSVATASSRASPARRRRNANRPFTRFAELRKASRIAALIPHGAVLRGSPDQYGPVELGMIVVADD
jgi:hypothetical protein